MPSISITSVSVKVIHQYKIQQCNYHLSGQLGFLDLNQQHSQLPPMWGTLPDDTPWKIGQVCNRF